MPVDLNALIAQHPALTVIAPDVPDPIVMATGIAWVHSSDLVDPTPWLEPGQVLLTDGMHFVDETGQEFARAYVERLTARGVLALGFATDILHDTVPDPLVAACRSAGLVLFEVADKTPFIGLIRFVADANAAEARERLEWSLQAQRAVARAALHPDGMRAIMAELARQLGSSVALYDSVGNRVELPGIPGLSAALVERVDQAAGEVLRRGGRAGLSIVEVGEGVALQTLGRGGHLLGVLAVGTRAPLGSAETDLVGSVIGLASIALEQRRALDGARARVRSGLIELLSSGAVDVAERTAHTLWGGLPVEPLRVTVVAGPAVGPALVDALEAAAERDSGSLFFAERHDALVVIANEADLGQVHELVGRHRQLAGTSSAVSWVELGVGMAEAEGAARLAVDGAPIVLYDELAERGLQGLLVASGGATLARRLLQPVLDLPVTERDTALATLAAWFAANCAWDPAARELGVHRHTLRNRIGAIQQLLGVDLESFSARAEVWSALDLLGPDLSSGGSRG